jgi:fructose-bisphosphate aldolase class II
MTAADEVGAPVILQASAGACNSRRALHQAPHPRGDRVVAEGACQHRTTARALTCKSAIDLGFSSVMMDGSP